MSENAQRIRGIAVGLAVVAVVVAALAALVVATRRSELPRREPRASRRVPASDLAKLTPETLEQAGDGVRVIDGALRTALGLTREDTIVAISGLRVTSASQLPRMLRDLGALTPSSLFVDLVRDREPVLERWELDGVLGVDRPLAGHGGSRGVRPSTSPPLDPLIATIQKTGRTTYEVPRSTVETWTAHPARVGAGTRAVGTSDGIHVVAIPPGSILEALGIHQDDLIRGINGVEIRSTDEALVAIAKSTRQITVDLRRDGQTILLNYVIQ